MDIPGFLLHLIHFLLTLRLSCYLQCRAIQNMKLQRGISSLLLMLELGNIVITIYKMCKSYHGQNNQHVGAATQI